jgi:hypothetical protein
MMGRISGVVDVTVVEHRRPPTSSKLARWAWIAVGLAPVGLILGVLGAFLAGGTGTALMLAPALLILAAPTAAVILAVAAARAGQRSGRAAVVAAGVLLVAALALVLAPWLFIPTGPPLAISVSIQWIITLVMVIATLALFGWRSRSTRVRASTGGAADHRHRVVRYVAAGVLAIAGITAALLWASAAAGAYGHYVGGLPRGYDRGPVTLHASHPGIYYVYAECGSSFDRTAAQVTGPAGRTVPVRATPARGYPYDASGGCTNDTRAVAEFHAARTGNYRIALTTGQAIFSVHDGAAANWLRPHEWGIAALLAVTVGTSIVLVATTIPQRQHPATSDGDPA